MSSIFVVVYDTPRPSLVFITGNYYWHRAEGTPQTIDSVGANPHFVGKYTPLTFQKAINSWDIQGAPQVIDTVGANPHFIGQFKPYKFSPAINSWDNEPSTPQTIDNVGANPHFITRFTSYSFNRAINSWDNEPSIPQVIDNVGFNPHFIGRFTNYSFAKAINSWDTVVSQVVQPETNTHFIAKFTSYTFSKAINSWDIQGTPQVIDTVGANPHFLGIYKSPVFQRVINSWDTTAATPIQPETNTHFIGKFTNYIFNKALNSWDNVGVSQAFAIEIPVNFIAKFTPVKLYNSVSYFSFDTATAFIPPPPGPTSGGRQVGWDEIERVERFSQAFLKDHNAPVPKFYNTNPPDPSIKARDAAVRLGRMGGIASGKARSK